MQTLTELLRTCLSIFGCGCLQPDFWSSRRRSRAAAAAAESPPAHRIGSDMRPQSLEELLLAPDQLGDGESASEAPIRASPEDVYRLASFNTKVNHLRSNSPFYRLQQPQEQAPRQQQQQPPRQQQQQATAAPASQQQQQHVELKPASSNMLLGQQHLEQRGKFVAAHPVRRGASPLSQPPLGI